MEARNDMAVTLQDLERTKADILVELRALGSLAAERLRSHLAAPTAPAAPSACHAASVSGKQQVRRRCSRRGCEAPNLPLTNGRMPTGKDAPLVDSRALESLFCYQIKQDTQALSRWQQELERRFEAQTPTPGSTPSMTCTGSSCSPASTCPASPMLPKQQRTAHSRFRGADSSSAMPPNHAPAPASFGMDTALPSGVARPSLPPHHATSPRYSTHAQTRAQWSSCSGGCGGGGLGDVYNGRITNQSTPQRASTPGTQARPAAVPRYHVTWAEPHRASQPAALLEEDQPGADLGAFARDARTGAVPVHSPFGFREDGGVDCWSADAGLAGCAALEVTARGNNWSRDTEGAAEAAAAVEAAVCNAAGCGAASGDGESGEGGERGADCWSRRELPEQVVHLIKHQHVLALMGACGVRSAPASAGGAAGVHGAKRLYCTEAGAAELTAAPTVPPAAFATALAPSTSTRLPPPERGAAAATASTSADGTGDGAAAAASAAGSSSGSGSVTPDDCLSGTVSTQTSWRLDGSTPASRCSGGPSRSGSGVTPSTFPSPRGR